MNINYIYQNVIHLEQKIFYKNKNYEIINDDHEVIEKNKKDNCEKMNKKLFYCGTCKKEMKINIKWDHIKKSKEHKINLEKSNK